MNEEHIGKCILDTARLVNNELNAMFYHENINGLQMRIMGFIHVNYVHGVDIYQKDIEAEFKMRRSSVTSVLNTMEKNNLVRRLSVPSDARLKKLELTAKAKVLIEAHYEKIIQFENSMVNNFSQDEINTLKSLLERVVENLDSIKRC